MRIPAVVCFFLFFWNFSQFSTPLDALKLYTLGPPQLVGEKSCCRLYIDPRAAEQLRDLEQSQGSI